MRFLWLNCTSNCCSSKPIMTSRFVESEAPPCLYKPGPPPLILTTQALLLQVLLLMRPLPSPSAAFSIPIASAARTALARVGLRNLCSLKVLHGTRAIKFLGNILTWLLAPWMTTSSTSWREWTTTSSKSRRERTTTSSTSWWPFVRLHCEPLPASTSFGYFRQGQSNRMSIPAGNSATSASGTGLALGYTLNLF
jgi:hypothetical protein